MHSSKRQIKSEHDGIGPSYNTIKHYVVDLGLVGMSPLRTGPEGNIPLSMYKSLCAAFGSFLQINQINAVGGVNSKPKMIPILANTMNISVSNATELIKRLCRDTAIHMKAGKLNFAEDRRVRWTTYSNLELWFDSWERTLLERKETPLVK